MSRHRETMRPPNISARHCALRSATVSDETRAKVETMILSLNHLLPVRPLIPVYHKLLATSVKSKKCRGFYTIHTKDVIDTWTTPIKQ